jgi:hypothetical protein
MGPFSYQDEDPIKKLLSSFQDGQDKGRFPAFHADPETWSTPGKGGVSISVPGKMYGDTPEEDNFLKSKEKIDALRAVHYKNQDSYAKGQDKDISIAIRNLIAEKSQPIFQEFKETQQALPDDAGYRYMKAKLDSKSKLPGHERNYTDDDIQKKLEDEANDFSKFEEQVSTGQPDDMRDIEEEDRRKVEELEELRKEMQKEIGEPSTPPPGYFPNRSLESGGGGSSPFKSIGPAQRSIASESPDRSQDLFKMLAAKRPGEIQRMSYKDQSEKEGPYYGDPLGTLDEQGGAAFLKGPISKEIQPNGREKLKLPDIQNVGRTRSDVDSNKGPLQVPFDVQSSPPIEAPPEDDSTPDDDSLPKRSAEEDEIADYLRKNILNDYGNTPKAGQLIAQAVAGLGDAIANGYGRLNTNFLDKTIKLGQQDKSYLDNQYKRAKLYFELKNKDRELKINEGKAGDYKEFLRQRAIGLDTANTRAQQTADFQAGQLGNAREKTDIEKDKLKKYWDFVDKHGYAPASGPRFPPSSRPSSLEKGSNPKDAARGEDTLRNELDKKGITTFRQRENYYHDMQESYKQLKGKNPVIAGVSLIYNYIKMHDPNAVLRKDKFHIISNAGSVQDKLEKYLSNAREGISLPDNVAKSILEDGRGILGSSAPAIKKMVTEYKDLAGKRGLNPKNIYLGEDKDFDQYMMPENKDSALGNKPVQQMTPEELKAEAGF